jgi:ankyrin repeat protein
VDHLIIVTIICALRVQFGKTPLTTAHNEGFIECVKLLLQAGAHVAEEVKHNLHTAASSLFLSVACIVCR